MLASNLHCNVPALKGSRSPLTDTEHTPAPEQVSGAGVLAFKLFLPQFTIVSNVFKNWSSPKIRVGEKSL